MNNIDIFNLMNISNPRIIDIRDNYKYSLGSIPGSINVPYLFLVTNPSNYMNKKETYYLLCDSGRTSYRCCLELVDYGYDVINVDGGYNAYLRYKEKT
jgi:rhodanese-related sulfurtransferase